ncbi:MAG: SixA phosphatase family protein [Candidatus Promineifilaceae bacterium]
MKTFLIFRHAKSSWSSASVADFDRPLNKRGERDAPLMGAWLKQQRCVPELILSSNARRAQSTIKAAAEAMGYNGDIGFTRAFYLAHPSVYIETAAQVSNEITCLMVVGHNSGLEELILELTDEYEVMPTGAIAHLTLPIDDWADFSAETPATLHAVWRPRELPASHSPN